MEKSELLRSHDELRAVLRLAGAEIRKLNFGRKDSPLLKLMRRELRKARAVAKAESAGTEKTKKAGGLDGPVQPKRKNPSRSIAPWCVR
jgi:hypothetical protein